MKVNVLGKVEIRTRITLAGKDQIKAFSLSKSDNHIAYQERKKNIRQCAKHAWLNSETLQALMGNIHQLWALSRGGVNFCVRSTPLRDATRRSLHN